jgi:hypothetical protein
MRRSTTTLVLGVCILAYAATVGHGQTNTPGKGSTNAANWSLNATIIEACSCPMFCQCYFNTSPAGHAPHAGHSGAEHFCRFNNTFRVNKGSYGSTKLDGVKFWLAGDLGGDFTKGMDWAVLHFDPTTTPAQRDALKVILPRMYPVTWKSFTIGDDKPMEWHYTSELAVAKLDGGKAGEVILKNMANHLNPHEPVIIKNLKYWGAPRNDGFIMMPNEVEAYRLGEKAFEFKGTNGFMITVDTDAATAPPPAAATGM